MLDAWALAWGREQVPPAWAPLKPQGTANPVLLGNVNKDDKYSQAFELCRGHV